MNTAAAYRTRTDSTAEATSENRRVDYLVGGFRISLDPSTDTPGPRTHIVNFLRGLDQNGVQSKLFLASSFPFMGRFAAIKQTDYADVSNARVWLADVVRVVAALWCGLNVFVRSAASPKPAMIYERLAVLQSLSSFHFWKGRAFRVVEANGILSRETAQDRNVLKSERLAAYLERRVLRRADLVVAVSARLKDELVTFASLDPDKIMVVPNGVPDQLLDYDRKPHTVRVAGFVGSVVKWHGLDRIIEEVAEVSRKSDVALAFEVIGDGAELASLRALVDEQGLADVVRLRGRMAQDDAFELMAGWDIGIASHQKSSSDSMYHSPLKLYEYAALGLSILCTDSNDARSLASAGADVRLFEDATQFAEQLQRMLVEHPRSAEEIEASRSAVLAAHSWRSRAAGVLRRAGM